VSWRCTWASAAELLGLTCGLPRIGRWVAQDEESYRYLAESIRMHPDQETLKSMMKSAGFAHVDVHNLTAGVVALHVGIRC
jgi:demethylmenaquinone methyltransferase/2-methoxy-6-polyprenyl-1,4-benzoquinol methylase